MKKIFLLLLTIPFLATSQIGKKKQLDAWTTLGELTNPYKYVELQYKEYDGEKQYMMLFQNMEYTTITDIGSFTFSATDEELEYFKQTLLDGIKLKKKDEPYTLDIGNGQVLISDYGSGVRMTYYEDGKVDKWTWFTKGQINKLFGG